MSHNSEMQATDNKNEWNNWIEEAISKERLKHYDYKCFNNIQEIGITSGFGKVYRANYEDSKKYLALKSLSNFDKITAKGLIHEVK